MRGWSLASAAAIVLICLVVQTAVQLRTMGVVSSRHRDTPLDGAALALRTSSAALKTAAGSMEKTSAALSELAPPVVVPPACGSLGFKGAAGFEAKHKEHRTRFLTMWTDPADDSKVYFEFELAALRAKPLTLGIGAVHARGAMAHFDASPYGVEDVAKILLAADGSGVDFQMWDMKHRTEDESYARTLEAGILPGQELRLLQVGSRSTLQEGVCEATHILVDGSPLVAEGFFATDPRPPPGSRPQVFAVKGHPENVGLTASYPAPPGEATDKPGEDAEDKPRPPARMVIRFSIYHLGDNPMPPRVADDRAGYFLTEFRLLGDYRSKGWHAQRPNELINPQVRFINRQRIRKPAGVNKDGKPIAELGCAGCKPGIHFYVDPTVPAPFHQATKDGVHRWRAAFKPLIQDPANKVGEWSAVGDEVIYAHAPGDESWPEDYDVGDFRFNTISWAMGEGRVFAVGMSVVDPRSGEILKANIVFTLGWLESWLGERLFYTAFPLKGADGEPVRTPGSSTARRLEAVGLPQSSRAGASARGKGKDYWHGEHACKGGSHLFRKRHPHESVMCRAFYDHGPSLVAMSLAMKDVTEDEALDFVRQGIADVTSHEVGHTLGLRHNFQGSLLVPFDKTQDAEWVAANGLSSSCMDYLASNVISEKTRAELVTKLNKDPKDPRSRAPFFTPIVGAYDRWAIKYGYSPLASETYSLTQKRDPRLIQIAGEYAGASFSFATDEDADSFDPFTRRFDLTSDPVAWQEEQYKLVREINAGDTMYDRAIRDGESWTNIATSAGRLIRAAGRAARGLVPFTSGLHASRRHARTGCTGASCVNEDPPKAKALRAMDAERQERALALIFEFLRADMDGDLLPDRSIQGHLVQRKDFFGMQPFDMASAVVTAKVGVLTELLSEERLKYLRVAEELGDQPEARKLIGTLLARCSKELVGGGTDPEADMPAVKKALQEPVQHEVVIAYYADLMELTKSTLTRITEAAWGQVTQQRELMRKLASDAEWAGFAHAALAALGTQR